METIEIKRGNAVTIPIQIFDDTDPENVIEKNIAGLTVFISVKKLSDDTVNDSLAIISSKITAHSYPALGMTTWSLSGAETLKPVGDYKCDLKLYNGAVELNTDTFIIKIVDTVTKRTT